MPRPDEPNHYTKHPNCEKDHARLEPWQTCMQCSVLWRNDAFKRGKQAMATKNNPGNFDCYAMALDDEPMFILLARDQVAPKTIEDWCLLREKMIEIGILIEAEERPKLIQAREVAASMRQWRQANLGKWKQIPLFEQPGFVGGLPLPEAIAEAYENPNSQMRMHNKNFDSDSLI